MAAGQRFETQLDASQRMHIGHLPRGVYFIEVAINAGTQYPPHCKIVVDTHYYYSEPLIKAKGCVLNFRAQPCFTGATTLIFVHCDS